MKIKLESAELPETEVIIRGDVTGDEVVSLLQLLKKRNSGKLLLYKEEEQHIVDANEIVFVEVSGSLLAGHITGTAGKTQLANAHTDCAGRNQHHLAACIF